MTDAEFGKLLKQRRCAAMLTHKELGNLAKVSDSTIKNTESGRKPASLVTISALLTVPELLLRLEEVPKRFWPALKRHEQSGTGGLPFLRFCLTNIGLSTQEAALRSVLDWCSEHRERDSRLEAWIRSTLRMLEQKRRTHLQLPEEEEEELGEQPEQADRQADKVDWARCQRRGWNLSENTYCTYINAHYAACILSQIDPTRSEHVEVSRDQDQGS